MEYFPAPKCEDFQENCPNEIEVIWMKKGDGLIN